MGSGGYSKKDWTSFSTSRGYDKASTKTEDIYSKSSIDDALDPKQFKFRESVDGPDNPESTPVIIGLDVTGSMTYVLDVMARKGMKTVCEEIYNRKPISDPHICALGIGDVECDRSPFQATQFEADIRIFKDLEKIWLEKGGGGNDHESYILAWYFAKFRTKTDSFAKRGRKGWIFTIGDEEITPAIGSRSFQDFLGDGQMRDYTAQELFDLVLPEWNVFHVIVKEGSHASRNYRSVYESWAKVVTEQHIIPLDDHTKIGEVIVSTMELAAGKNLADIAGTWDNTTALAVNASLAAIEAGGAIQKGIDSYL